MCQMCEIDVDLLEMYYTVTTVTTEYGLSHDTSELQRNGTKFKIDRGLRSSL